MERSNSAHFVVCNRFGFVFFFQLLESGFRPFWERAGGVCHCRRLGRLHSSVCNHALQGQQGVLQQPIERSGCYSNARLCDRGSCGVGILWGFPGPRGRDSRSFAIQSGKSSNLADAFRYFAHTFLYMYVCILLLWGILSQRKFRGPIRCWCFS